jgi:hypothetical protein
MKSISVLGAGKAVGESDFLFAWACDALRAHGHRVVVVDPNPATVTTDSVGRLEPITPAVVEKIIDAERPEALLPLGDPACATALAEAGVLAKHEVELLGPRTAPVVDVSVGERLVELQFARDRDGATAILGVAEELGPVTVAPAYEVDQDRLRDLAARAIDEPGLHTVRCAIDAHGRARLAGVLPPIGPSCVSTVGGLAALVQASNGNSPHIRFRKRNAKDIGSPERWSLSRQSTEVIH